MLVVLIVVKLEITKLFAYKGEIRLFIPMPKLYTKRKTKLYEQTYMTYLAIHN